MITKMRKYRKALSFNPESIPNDKYDAWYHSTRIFFATNLMLEGMEKRGMKKLRKEMLFRACVMRACGDMRKVLSDEKQAQ